MSACGIYKITCTGNNHFYIGQSCEYFKRFWRHINDLKTNKHCNTRLQRCFDKYGIESFEIELFEVCAAEQLDEREQYWLDYHCGNPLCANLSKIANKPPSTKGKITSEETKKKISLANTGHKHTDEAKALIGKAAVGHQRWLGKKHTDEAKRKISAANESSVEKQLLSPTGIVIKFCNLSEFCNDNGLDRGAIYRVLNEKVRSHQGWTKP